MQVKTIRAVSRAVDVLYSFLGPEKELGPSAIAERVGLDRATVLRMLVTLEERGLLNRNEGNQKYRLGPRVVELAGKFLETDDLAGLAYPEVRRLRDEYNETVSIYIRDGTERICIQRLESNHSLKRNVRLGQRLPLYAGASAKVFLAFMPDEERTALVNSLPVPTGFRGEQLLVALPDIRQAGFAISLGEREEGIGAVAAPIFNRRGKVVAALSLSGPAARLNREKLYSLGSAVREAAQRISNLILDWSD
ncbi:MAG: IclR family transcriptional regulator [Firmicutes bacterium]|nr:IclR family transcriptional regulator [Bacillota bacterium]MCL5039971.1 IclR family transcriptional regulator [Bacillota bacterium]